MASQRFSSVSPAALLRERAASRWGNLLERASTDAVGRYIAAVYLGTAQDTEAVAKALSLYNVEAGGRSAEEPILLPYQREWLTDTGRRQLYVKARRIGGSFTIALKDALRACGIEIHDDGAITWHPDRGVPQRIVSASEDQAQELLALCGTHLEVIEALTGKRIIEAQSLQRIILTSGVRLVAMAPSPRTIRGGEGDVTLDEFAHMPRTDRVWQAAKSITDPTLARPSGYRLNVVSSPFGDDNMFYRLARTEVGDAFHRHEVDINEAREQGFPAEPNEVLRQEAGDEDAFSEEYLCAFLSAKARYISADLFDACLAETVEMPRMGNRPDRYGGMDVARKSTGDLSALATLYRVGSTLYDESLETRRGERWAEQESWADDTIDRCGRFAVDATGLGNQFAEGLVESHGERVIPVEFNTRSKEQVITGLRYAMEQGRLRLRSDSDYMPQLRKAVLSLRREITAAGNVRYDAERTKDGHADEAIALALAVHAAGQPAASLRVTTGGTERATAGLRRRGGVSGGLRRGR